jgi:hypothetical protein
VDAETLAEGLEFFLTQPEVLAAAGRAAKASAEQYSEARFVKAWNGVFLTASKAHHAG